MEFYAAIERNVEDLCSLLLGFSPGYINYILLKKGAGQVYST